MQSLPHLPDFLGNMIFHMARNFGHHHNDYTNHPIPKKRRPKRKALKTDKKRRTLGCAVKLSGIVNNLFFSVLLFDCLIQYDVYHIKKAISLILCA